MNLPIDARLQATIRNIEHRESQGPQPIRHLKVPTIPKTVAYYQQMIRSSQKFKDPYVESVYNRALKLCREGKHDDISKLIKTANIILSKKRGVVAEKQIERKALAPVRKLTHKYQTRSKNITKHSELYKIRNLKSFIIDYTQKVKHKKENLFNFLKSMYELNKKYKTSTFKFAKIRINKGHIA